MTGHASRGIFNRGPEAGAILALGNYRDDVVKVDGKWLYKNRYISFLF